MKHLLPSRDCIQGSDLALPLVIQIRTLRSHDATRLTWHSHECYELICVLHGAASYELTDQRTLELAGGHFALIPPGVVHRGLHDVRTPVTLCGIQFDPRRSNAARNATITQPDLAFLRSQLQRAGLQVRAYSSDMRHSLDQLVVEKDLRLDESKSPLAWAGIRTLACKIILEATRLLGLPESNRPQEYILAAKQFLMQRLEHPFCLADLVQRLGISRSRLFTLFKAETGMTPNDYFVRCRIEGAQRLLAQTDQPITEIALDVGFNSSQYFSRAFWRYTDQTPREFRQRSQAGKRTRARGQAH
jgi:AraC-like DNA-binding protein